MRVVLIDTSLMLDCVKRKIDVFTALGALMDGPFEAVVPSGALGELERKAMEKGAKGAEARFALAILKKAAADGVVRVETSVGLVDGWIVAKASEVGGIVCTNDAGLRRRARQKGLQVVSIMGNSRLGFA